MNASTGEITAEGAGSATITFNEINGSSSSIVVNVYSVPATPSIAYSDGTTTLKTICIGGQATILVQSPSTGVNYEWEYSDVAAFTNASSVAGGNPNGTYLDVSTPGYYRVEVRIQRPIVILLILIFWSWTTIVFRLLTISFVGIHSGQATAITCDGSSVTLQATRTNVPQTHYLFGNA